MRKLVAQGKPGIYPIVGSPGFFNGTGLRLDKTLSAGAMIGGLDLHANGALVISRTGAYRFKGSVTADPDKYDFNKRNGRSLTAAFSTAIGRKLPGKIYHPHDRIEADHPPRASVMVPWEIFAKGVGCFALFLASCFGLFLGVSISWYESLSLPYINRRTALLYGLQNAQAHYIDEQRKPPVDCEHFSLLDIREDYVGWHMTFLSADRRRTESMFIRRRGEYDERV